MVFDLRDQISSSQKFVHTNGDVSFIPREFNNAYGSLNIKRINKLQYPFNKGVSLNSTIQTPVQERLEKPVNLPTF